MLREPALVGIVPRKNLWEVIQKERWYHIPIQSAPKNALLTEYIAFYFPKEFGEKKRYKVSHYARVKKVDVVKRIQLFPKESGHRRAYLRFSGKEIHRGLQNCLTTIEKTINNLGGLNRGTVELQEA